MLNLAKQKLQTGEIVSSMAVRLVRTPDIALIAHSAGFDSLYIDMEHNSFTIAEAGQICMAALAYGVTPFVRIPADSIDLGARLLDAGALGLIVPHLQTADDVRRVVDVARFPPLGSRGAVNNLPHFGYRTMNASEAGLLLNESTMVIGMVETLAALKNVDEMTG
jgi:2-keto-3-deoxy-L-rhamnonate aldolase RhmA